MKYVIGIDPDSNKHGVAIYENKKLIALESLSLMSVMSFLQSLHDNEGPLLDLVEIHIENVCGNNAVFAERRNRANFNTIAKMSNGVGKCQQAQIELERMLIRFQLVPVKHKVSKAWKKDKKQFELVTGWTGRSNEDTRSAAYFGWLGLK